MNFQTMNQQRKYILIAAAVGVIAMFLPWVEVSLMGMSQTASNGMHGKGVLIFICFLGCGLLAIMGDQLRALDNAMWVVVLIAGALGLLLTLWVWSSVGSSAFGMVQPGFGIYIAALSAIGVVVSAWRYRSPGSNIKDGFNSLKGEIDEKMKSQQPEKSGSTPPPPPPTPSEDIDNGQR